MERMEMKRKRNYTPHTKTQNPTLTDRPLIFHTIQTEMETQFLRLHHFILDNDEEKTKNKNTQAKHFALPRIK